MPSGETSGSGNFECPQGFLAYQTPREFAVEDYNRDGKLDLAVARFGLILSASGDVALYWGDGAGGFVDLH